MHHLLAIKCFPLKTTSIAFFTISTRSLENLSYTDRGNKILNHTRRHVHLLWRLKTLDCTFIALIIG